MNGNLYDDDHTTGDQPFKRFPSGTMSLLGSQKQPALEDVLKLAYGLLGKDAIDSTLEDREKAVKRVLADWFYFAPMLEGLAEKAASFDGQYEALCKDSEQRLTPQERDALQQERTELQRDEVHLMTRTEFAKYSKEKSYDALKERVRRLQERIGKLTTLADRLFVVLEDRDPSIKWRAGTDNERQMLRRQLLDQVEVYRPTLLNFEKEFSPRWGKAKGGPALRRSDGLRFRAAHDETSPCLSRVMQIKVEVEKLVEAGNV